MFLIMTGSEIELWLKQYGCILREFMFKTDTETMALAECGIRTRLRIVELNPVCKHPDGGTFLLHKPVRTVIKVISGQVHPVVKERERPVDSAHP